MEKQVAVGPARQATSLQNCDEKLSKCHPCDSKEAEGVQGADVPVDSSKSNIADRSLALLMDRTGYSIVQLNGQRHYGPPPGWTGSPPPRGCEVFVGKIPRDCYEDELVPAFERAGRIYEMRLMMDYNGMNRGYAFVVYTQPSEAKECVRLMNNSEIRKGRTLGVCMSVDNCRLFVGGIPKKVRKEDIRNEMLKVTEGVVDVIVYPSASDKSKNRGFAFIEYDSHRSAAMARRKLMQGQVQLWGHQVAVDWAEPELEVDEEVMAQVKVLYVRNLMLSSTEAGIEEAFSEFAPVERVKKIRDYAFVHFHTREGALNAMEKLNGSDLDGAVIEVTLAKPVDKDNYPRSPRHGRQYGVPAIGIVPIDYTQLVPAIYPGYYPTSPKYIPRNSMGARVVRSPRRQGRSHGMYPITAFGPQFVFPASPVQGPYVSQYYDSPKRAQISEEPFSELIPGVDLSPAAAHQAAAAPSLSNHMKRKSPVALLEEICTKNQWGLPMYTLNSASHMPDGQYFQYKVTVPMLGSTYLPTHFSRSTDEARSMAAEIALVQLGYPLEAGFTSPQTIHTPTTPLTPEMATFASPSFLALASAAKHCSQQTTSWPEHTAMFTGYDATYTHQQYQHTPDIYRRSF